MSRSVNRPLGDLVDVLSGFAFNSDQFGDSGHLPIVRIRDVVPGRSSTFYRGEFDTRYVLQDGDLLIGMDGEFNRGRWQGGKALLNQRVCRISPSSNELDEPYLFHFLPAALKSIEDVTPFVTVKHLSVSTIREIEIPLPPISEQRRIAAILDQAEALRAKRRAALAKLEVLQQSIFLAQFDAASRSDWPVTNIAGLADSASGSIRTGPFGSQLLHGEFVSDGVAVLGIDNVVANEFRWGERRFITEAKYRQLKRYTVRPGDVLITIMGTCGRCAVVPDDVPVAINTKHLCCITLDSAKALPLYLQSYFLRHPLALRYLEQAAKGAIMSGLNMAIIKDMPIPIPPLKLQHQYAAQVTSINRVKSTHRASLAKLDALFATLQHRAFRGEL